MRIKPLQDVIFGDIPPESDALNWDRTPPLRSYYIDLSTKKLYKVANYDKFSWKVLTMTNETTSAERDVINKMREIMGLQAK